MYLQKILDYKLEELEHFKRRHPLRELQAKVLDLPKTKDFTSSLRSPPVPYAIIAEIKKRSPSKGILRESFDPETIARDYESHGASALSVLTDEHFFGGSLDYLRNIRKHVALPLLRKDFIWDHYQIYEAREAGADAVLLIVAALEKNQLVDLQGLAQELGLSVLVEIHDLPEAQIALAITPHLVGVNHRNLKTFEIDLSLSEKLFPIFDASVLRVSESGIQTSQQLKELKSQGADAFLIGENFMTKPSPGKALSELLQNP